MNFTKKLLLASLSAVMTFGAAGCSSNSAPDTETEAPAYVNAQELLLKVWQADEDENKPAVFGGAGDDITENEPMAVNLSDPELLENAFTVPADLIDASESGASLMNAMMANHFTASAWQLKSGTNAAAIAKSMSEKVANNQWICAFPEEYYILQTGDYLILVYGLSDVVKPFVNAFESVCANGKVLYNEPIA